MRVIKDSLLHSLIDEINSGNENYMRLAVNAEIKPTDAIILIDMIRKTVSYSIANYIMTKS